MPTLRAQQYRQLNGLILDQQNTPVENASISVKGGSAATSSEADGTFSLRVPTTSQTLVVTKLGHERVEIEIRNQDQLRIILNNNNIEIEETVVVGYGKQKKESLTGAIVQTTGEVLQRAGGVTNLGMALTGNLPGLVTTSSTGMPGAEDPQMLIRAQTSWNNSSPLILVDGIERSISSVDISSVETVSVLKDASATAVFGVKGANGVILITTKQGKKGKANIQLRSNMTTKMASKLPEKYDSYDALSLKNQTIEREILINGGAWTSYLPEEILNKYRNPASEQERDQYPNVDWEKELFKDYTMSHNTSASVSGGSDFVTYFANVDFVSEGDLFKTIQNGRGYAAGYGYTRTNVRSNLNFNLTPTTKFSTKLFGSNGVRKLPWGAADGDTGYWASAYRTSPDAMWPVYSDGTWGYYEPKNADVPNSVYILAMSGVEKKTRNQLTTDFTLEQDLKIFLKGLNARANFSLDNTFQEIDRGINDLYNNAQRKWIDPETGVVSYEGKVDLGTQLDFSDGVRWSTESGAVDIGATYRRVNYSFQLNYANKFGDHDVSAMGVFMREQLATGSMFSRYREDWVFRTTYNYAMKYFLEVNGAYNGSEQFGPDYRFEFFSGLSGGWTLSNEEFMKNISFLSLLKFRGSWGRIGDDNVNGRWLYADQWSYGGNTVMGDIPSNTPYTYYSITQLGNPNISWETAEKRNLALEFGFFKNKVTGSIDFFKDHRTDIIIGGGSRAIPSYFGVSAPNANLGEVKGKGYEIELGINHTFSNGLRLFANTNMTHAVNTVIFRDDPKLRPTYQQNAGYPLGQNRAYLDNGFLQSWDDVLGSTQRNVNNDDKLPGDYNIVDYNADGVIDNQDVVPYKYSSSPQNTYNASIGFDWKGWNLFLQFYGVNNVTREVSFPTFHSTSNVAYVEGTYWSVDEGGDIPYPRWSTTVGPEASGTRYQFDGSYIRLKNAEIGYTLPNHFTNRFGVNLCKIYLNGNNLWLWTRMPDDRESNFSGNSSFGAYPTMRRFNVGLDITF
ncbi:SusC/RagA family TonB-linked outer membrane protein [Sphingobacterium alkalisoli]|uniref:SusC/RagA family TonB-linked outer membrane protein n=2 Tax=Sphingobacterium alkalisoli TaxID=1874115 RepID=A0A4V5LYN3_9SPHI|nr:SusC/RagA family TonB-linked outer membrane protein [Sphingobacterium alkalisoli]GGH15473.1 SusC/RagA family TonB-linked outer membrane protein [Sphingobacterium alkalisoli]